MYYFGYYIQFGCPCSLKWTGDKAGPEVAQRVNVLVQVQELNAEEFKWTLSHLAAMYPYKELE